MTIFYEYQNPLKKNSFQPLFVLIIIICSLLGGSIGYELIQNNLSPTPKNIDYLVVERDGTALDSLKVVYKNQFEIVPSTTKKKSSEDQVIIDSYQVSSAVVAKKSKTQTKEKVHRVDISKTLFHQNVPFLAWTMLIFILLGIAGGAMPYFAAEAWNLKRKFEIGWWIVVIGFISSIAFAIIAGVFAGQGNGLYKPDEFIDHMGVLLENGAMLKTIVLITMVLQVTIFTTIFLIPVAANRIQAIKDDKASITEAARKFELLERVLKKCLHVLAILVVFSGLTSSALAASIKNTIEISGFEIFPQEISFAYGLLFSFFLAMIYLPVHAYIRFKSRTFIDDLSDSNQDTLDHLDKVKDLILVKQGALQSFKVAFTVIAPLVTSFLPQFISG